MEAPRHEWPTNPLRWFPEFYSFQRKQLRAQVRMLASSVLVGIVAGVAAIVFYVVTLLATYYTVGYLAGYEPTSHPAGEVHIEWMRPFVPDFRPWLLLVIPTVGGLLSGLLVYTYAPEAEGHGTDSVIASYHYQQGYIRPRVPLIKIVASALTIGSGGSGGREGPIAQIGAGFGSYLADLLRFGPTERRILMAAGMGAGIAAIFRAPLAGALFAAEVLYRSPEFEPEVILPAALASVVSYCTFGAVFGWQPLFDIPEQLAFKSPLELGPYTVLAVSMAILAMLYTRTFYAVGDLFRSSPIARKLRPAVGAFLTGAVGLALYYLFGGDKAVLAVLSFGYGAVQYALSSDISASASLLVAISLGKLLTTSLTIASGGSGGVFGPSMVIGGCGGGALGYWMHQWWPNLVQHPASYVIVGMAGFFAAAAKTPFSTLIIVGEMTGGYALLLPALWVVVLSFMLSDEQSIYSSQVEGRSRSPAHQGFFVRDALAGLCVRDLLSQSHQAVTLSSDAPLQAVIAAFEDSGQNVLPVADEAGQFHGVIRLATVFEATQLPDVKSVVVAADLVQANVEPLSPGDDLEQAMQAFVLYDVLALPVVDNTADGALLGMMPRSAIAGAYLRQLSTSAPVSSNA